MEIGEFFTKLTGLTPSDDQRAFMSALIDPKRKSIAASCGRQTGKSLCSAVAVLWWVFEYPTPVDVLLMSSMDSYVYDHIERIFNKMPEFSEQLVTEGVSGLVPLRGFSTKKGSRVHVRGATNKQVRGLGVDLTIVDEVAEIPRELLTTALGNNRGELAKTIWLSTGHKEGLFTEVIRSPTQYGFETFTWSEENCPWHSKESLAQKKRMMSIVQYKVEVQGLVPSAEDRALFPTKHIDACIHDDIKKENSPHSTVEAGVDWGFDPCQTVLSITERIFNRRRVLLSRAWRRKPVEETAPEIAGLLEKYGVGLVKADSKPDEYKHKLEKYTKVPIYYITATAHKDAMVAQLQRKIRQHHLEVPSSEIHLILQLRKYRRGKRTGDDEVDALALSCYEPAEPLEPNIIPTAFFSKSASKT